MKTLETQVAGHYGRFGLADQILMTLRECGKDINALKIDDLSPFDEFHIGGQKTTEHLLTQLGLKAGMNILDIGSGIGGPARYAAVTYGATVTGIDLTPEFCETATILSDKLGLGKATVFQAGSALSMPFEREAFDAAYSIHVGMNIEDKAGLYREAHRVLKPGALLGICDILALSPGAAPCYPVPWAETTETSFLPTIEEIQEILKEAGFDILSTENRQDFALSQFRRKTEPSAEEKQSAIIKGKGFKQKSMNLKEAVQNNICAPWEILCKRL